MGLTSMSPASMRSRPFERAPADAAGCFLASVVNRRDKAPRGAGDEVPFRSGLTLKFVSRAPILLASAACRGVPATRAGGPSAAKNKRRRVPFRVPSFVLVAQRRRRWRGPPAGTPRFASLVLDRALSRDRLPYELIRVLRLERKKGLRGVRVVTAGLAPVTLTGCKPRESWARRAR